MEIQIRKPQEKDVPQLWQLMKELAVFEKYIDSFAITPEVVLEKGFRKSPPDFYSLVAEDTGSDVLAGMLVYYLLPYTAQNKPAIFLKELYVLPAYRGHKIGEALMIELAKEAVLHQCCSVKWNVAPWNKEGIRFYQRLGAEENRDWLNFEWDAEQFKKAANR